MSNPSRSNFPKAASDSDGLAVETSVRQLIANGKSRTALENAKDFHKARNTPASESLLLDAYVARIQGLLDQNMTAEAASLANLVRERFPSASGRLDGIRATAAARGGEISEFLRLLADPGLTAERRGEIERIIETEVTDLGTIASSSALPPEHNLRKAAAALDRAFQLVTSGLVTDEQIALPEVSHRSPLASWKVLIRAIAALHRGDDDACRAFLDAIRPETAPGRLVPPVRAMLGAPGQASLKPAAAALVSRVVFDLKSLRDALAKLDHEFAEDEDEGRIFRAVREATKECRRCAPDRLTRLKELIAVRAALSELDQERLNAAMDGPPRHDAAFFRAMASALESTGDPEKLAFACDLWDQFRMEALREGWFRAGGVEEAAVLLRLAETARRVPEGLRTEISRSRRPGIAGEAELPIMFPDRIYSMACSMDPHADAFTQWMNYARELSARAAEKVASAWNKSLPGDIEPLLYLMEQAEKRRAIPKALSFLEKAERIDAVHSVVRAARLRLLAAGAMRHLEQRKPHLAAAKLKALEELPQLRQGDRPAFSAALRYLILRNSGDQSGAAQARLEATNLLGEMAAGILIFGLAAISKCLEPRSLRPAKANAKEDLRNIPACMARLVGIARDFGIANFVLPVDYVLETEVQFPAVSDTLDAVQLRGLGDLGLATERPGLVWAASTSGLMRGGPTEAGFLLLRARALPAGHGPRYLAIAAAAAALGRFHQDKDVVDRAVEIVRNPFGGDSISLTIEQAREVIRKEIASPGYPTQLERGPDYSDLMPDEECQCPDCRRSRGEGPDLFDEYEEDEFEEDEEEHEEDDFGLDEAEIRRIFYANAPKGVPREVSEMLFQIMKEALTSGVSPEEASRRLLGDLEGGSRKGRRKR